jgi:hypothetical protein
LKELKIGTSNKKGLEKTTLQCDQVLECLKATNGHATKNILKKHQSLIVGPSILIPITSTSYTSPSLDSTPSGSDGEKSMTKSKML